jgi:hypothetical protein
LANGTSSLKGRLDREIKKVRDEMLLGDEATIMRLEEEVMMIQKKMARDRADNELKFSTSKETMADHTKHLSVIDVHLNTLAVMTSTMVENVNMQMEAETSDLIDRRMMQLFAVAHPQPTKADVTAGLGKLPGQNKYSEEKPFGRRLASQIAVEGIPELGLEGK